MSEKERCLDCRFWAGRFMVSADFHEGYCQRHAPSLNLLKLFQTGYQANANATEWPMTLGGYWCGDFQRKPAEESSSDQS